MNQRLSSLLFQNLPLRLLPIILVGFCTATNFTLCGQTLSSQVVSNGGNTVIAPQMRLSWTLGEIAVTRWEAPNNSGILTEGFHQPSIQLSKNTLSNSEVVQIVPNPVRGLLNLKLSSAEHTVFLANLHDSQGRILLKNILLKNSIEIDMSNYPAGVYFLTIRQTEEAEIQRHKIVKL
jgi:hypothetical protein